MNGKWKTVIPYFLVLVLLASLVLGCGAKKAEGRVTIKVGVITDLTGPDSAACIPLTWAVQNTLKYLQRSEPIQGVELKLDIYDARLDHSRWLNTTRQEDVKQLTRVPRT